ncbi:hypothetical protein TUM4261_23000 [Shewanella sp. c952]|uniref:Uncharacterized protein n=1 Tax=Shewanella piezotolerans (strain WP3 / JCM 13877) TaxID=225849 RepID=B8CVT5_SHEPW|nr:MULTISPECIES: hypothetical protein [Shewanella]ACJ31761.1 Conserved hypothetical protein [Shewanella piezotolerans WP3]GIU11412.1 hypothetical protein TUM4261_23000 [Shewanella sp. c952]
MERIREAQEHLKSEFEIYNNASAKKLPPLDIDCPEKLETMLEFVTRRESLKQAKKLSSPPAGKLKAAIADTLLLLDNFDIKISKEKGAAEK